MKAPKKGSDIWAIIKSILQKKNRDRLSDLSTQIIIKHDLSPIAIEDGTKEKL